MGTMVQNNCIDILVTPFQCGWETIENNWYGRTVQPITGDEPSVEARVAGIIIGIALMIPLINILILELVKLFEGQNIVVIAAEKTFANITIPLPNLRAAAPSIFLEELNQSHTVFNAHIIRAATETENIPEPPQAVRVNGVMTPVTVDALRNFIGRLNFDRPDEPGYREPGTIEDDGNVISHSAFGLREEIHNRIEAVIQRINDRASFSGIPHNAAQKTAYYNNLEKLIKHIVRYLYEQEDLDIINSTLIDLACMQTHCGGRYMGEAHRLYGLLKNRGNDFENMTVEGKILAKLKDCRSSILLQIIEEEQPNWMNSMMAPHTYNFYLRKLGRGFGIPGADAGNYEDPYGHYRMDERDERRIHARFNELYSAAKVHSYAYEVFNASDDDFTGIHPDIAIDWFRENVPAAFVNEKREEVLQAHLEEFREAQDAQNEAIRARDALLLQRNALDDARRDLANELVLLTSNLDEHWRGLDDAGKTALLDRFAIPQDARLDLEGAFLSLRARVTMAMNMPQNAQLIAHLYQPLNMTDAEVDQFRNDIRRFITHARTANAPLPNEHLTEDEIAEQIKDLYLQERVVEVLPDEQGQRIRASGVVDCLMQLNILHAR